MNERHLESQGRDNAQNAKHVWVVDHYTSLPSKQGNSRHLNLAQELPRYGWTSSLIVASTTHPSGQQTLHGPQMRKLATQDGIQTLSVRTIAYGSSLPLRFLGMILFALNLLRPGMTNGLQRPDAVIGSTVHPFAAWAGWRLAKRHRVPFIYEIRDVWPESLFDLARIDKDHPVSRVIAFLDAALARHADLVLSPLPFVDRHLVEIGYPDKPFLWVPNGFVAPQEPAELVERVDGAFTFMYLGAHGRANALGGLLEAFSEACKIAPELDLRLRLVGDGPLKGDLKALADSLPAADRITFEARIPASEVITRAREADCLVANLYDQPVFRFGVSPNKYFMYLAAGRPVVAGSSAPNNPIADASAGLVVPGGDTNAMADALVAMARMPLADRAKMVRAGHQLLLEQYTWETLAEKLADGLDSQTSGTGSFASSRGGAEKVKKTRTSSVVHVSSVHPWTDNRIHYRECVSLAEAGFEVTLIAVESDVQGPETAVKVITIPRRSRLARMVVSTTSAIRIALRTRARIVHLHDPELIPFIPLLRLAGRVVIYDAHEDLPNQVINKPYVRRTFVPAFAGFARLLVRVSRLSHHVICATETIAQRYPAHQRTIVHNYPPLRAEETAAENNSASGREAVAVYVGGISTIRGAQTMVDTMAEDDLPEGWKLVVAGSGAESLLDSLKSRPGWHRVDFRGQVPPEEARRLLLKARVGLVLFADTAAHRDALPTKMFEYFAAGTPVIASDFPLWRTIIQANDCGLLVNPASSAEVAAAIRRYAEDPDLLDRHSRNARRLAREELNWSSEAKALVSVYSAFSTPSPKRNDEQP